MMRPATLLVTACLAAFPQPRAQEPRAGQARPDIVVMMADDMGFSDLGCYGGEIDTPNLDRLAANGLRFSRFYNTARCCPTRASLLTGVYPHRAGVGHMMEDRGHDGYRGELHAHVPTVAEVLRSAGYGTAMVGKWHVSRHTGVEGPMDNWPLQRGFQRFFGTITGAGSFFQPTSLKEGNEPYGGDFDGFYYTDAIGSRAARYVRETDSEERLFLYVAFTAPHWPLHARDEDIARYRDVYRDGWDRLRERRYARLIELGLVEESFRITPRDPVAPVWEDLEEDRRDDLVLRMAVYAAQVHAMDRAVGHVVEALEETGRLQDTLILFLSDNGGCAEGGPFGFERKPGGRIGTDDSFASYGLGWANASNTPFRLYKHWVHEGGIATPLIAHWPAGITARGEITHEPGHVVDLLPTCMELAGAVHPEQFRGSAVPSVDGRSLVPAFRAEPIDRDAIYWEHEGNRAMLEGRWKLVARGARGPWELYDIETDRTEQYDLAQERPDRVRRMAAAWQTWAESSDVLPLRPPRVEPRFSKARSFELGPDDSLEREKAPMVRRTPFRFSVRVSEPGEGVLIAQGGDADGWAVYQEGGVLRLAVRRSRALFVLSAETGLPPKACVVTGALRNGGNVTVSVDGVEVIVGKVPGLLTAMPGEGLQVGRDAGAAVGTYDPGSAFTGRIAGARVELTGGSR